MASPKLIAWPAGFGIESRFDLAESTRDMTCSAGFLASMEIGCGLGATAGLGLAVFIFSGAGVDGTNGVGLDWTGAGCSTTGFAGSSLGGAAEVGAFLLGPRALFFVI